MMGQSGWRFRSTKPSLKGRWPIVTGMVSGGIGEVVGLLETAATMLRERGEAADGMLAALHANAEAALARAEAATATEREARKRAEVARADAEARLAQFREDLERVSREAEARFSGADCQREGRGRGGAAQTGKSGPPGPRFAGATARGPWEGVSCCCQ